MRRNLYVSVGKPGHEEEQSRVLVTTNLVRYLKAPELKEELIGYIRQCLTESERIYHGREE